MRTYRRLGAVAFLFMVRRFGNQDRGKRLPGTRNRGTRRAHKCPDDGTGLTHQNGDKYTCNLCGKTYFLPDN
jgi:hypothetical protein